MPQEIVAVLAGVLVLFLPYVAIQVAEAVQRYRTWRRTRPLSPAEYYMRQQVRKRDTIRQLRQIVQDHKEGRY